MTRNDTSLPLPRHWPRQVKAAILNVVSLAQHSMAYVRGWCANGTPLVRLHLAGQLERAQTEIALLREEIRIKDKRMGLIPAHRRPFYPPTERMAILELRAARAWSLGQTARAFLVEDHTISSWTKRVDEQGPNALVQIPQPVNKFPDFVRRLVARLKVLCPHTGKKKIAQTLARAGLHLASTTVKNMLKKPVPEPRPAGEEVAEPAPTNKPAKPRTVTAKRPNHVWHADLTLVPIAFGFWVPWLPNALLQFWPFAYWVLAIADHFSRRVLRLAVFKSQPTSRQVRAEIGRTIACTGKAPKYIIADQGPQFSCPQFQHWCENHPGRRSGIRLRYGAVGKYGSLAIVERFIRSMKTECTRRILVPLRRQDLARELSAYLAWFNEHRPHEALKGKTPNEVYFSRSPMNERPRLEPRPRYPKRSPCAAPQAKVNTRVSDLHLDVTYYEGRQHLPIVRLRPAS